MQADGARKYSGGAAEAMPTGTKEGERRGNDRCPFTAQVEVIEIDSEVRFSGRTTDLGPGGCFVDTLVPFVAGAKVRVFVHKDKQELETNGTVVYSQTGLGMGIAFNPLKAEQRTLLETWLREVTGTHQYAFKRPSAPNANAAAGASGRAAFIRLIQLLVSKGVLTEEEASSVFHNPII
jgi:hypothetical protein